MVPRRRCCCHKHGERAVQQLNMQLDGIRNHKMSDAASLELPRENYKPSHVERLAAAALALAVRVVEHELGPHLQRKASTGPKEQEQQCTNMVVDEIHGAAHDMQKRPRVNKHFHPERLHYLVPLAGHVLDVIHSVPCGK